MAAVVLLCACAGSAQAALTVAAARQGPIARLAQRNGSATVEVTLTGDPRPAGAFPAVVADARASLVASGSTTTAVRTPVLLVVRPGRAMARWLGLLPSTRLRVRARLVPTQRSDDRAVAVLRTSGPPEVVGAPSAVQRFAGRLRAGLRRAAGGLAPDTAALLSGLVVGDTSGITPRVRSWFEATDLLHLIAVSGANLGIVLMVLTGPPASAARAERGGLAAWLGLPLRWTAVLGGLLVSGFVVVCRPEPSVLRAAGCGLIALLALWTGRRRVLLPALAASVIALLLYDPWLSRSFGFALSVLATGALLVLAPRWAEALRRHGVPERLAEAVAAAAAAQVCCAPLLVVPAARISLVAIPCNLLAEAAVAPATVLGVAALLAAPLTATGAGLLARLAGWPTGWVLGVARWGSGLPGATAGWPGGWTGGVLLAVALAGAVPLCGRLLRRGWGRVAVAGLLLVAVARPAPLVRWTTGWPPAGWRLAVCDVGQGDALVLDAGPASAVVVDTGPDPAAADRCLRALGVSTVPLLVITHFHADHAGGLAGVLHGRRVGAIETTTLDEPAEQADRVCRQAAAAGVPVIRAVAGEHRRLGALDWRVLWPLAGAPAGLAGPAGPSPDRFPGGFTDPDADPNDAGVVLLVETGGLTFLLLSDLGPEAQRELLAREPGLPRVDVLKVAHHGSARQDPDLPRRLRPRLAIVSVGAGNSYGQPAPATLAALRAVGAEVLRTDSDGAVAVTPDGTGGLRAATARAP